ncbi:MAG: PilW family protein [Pyrinomonadaceae bacterium]
MIRLKTKNRILVPSNAQKGFTLLELLVAMTIFLVVISLIYGILQIGRVDRNRSSRRSDILKNARIAVHMIGRDALNAGLGYHRKGAVAPDNFVSSTFGIPADANTDRDLITSVIAGNDINANDLNGGAPTDVIGFCFRDMDFNDGDVINLSSVAPAAGNPSAALVTAAGIGNAGVGDLFLVESDTSQVAIMATGLNGNVIEAAPGDPLGLNQPLDGTGQNGSVLRQCNPPVGDPPVPDDNCTPYVSTTANRFFMVGYKVRQDGTLVRTIFGNNRSATNAAEQIQEQPLAYNVQNLQISYVLADGTVTENPAAGLDGILGTADDDIEQLNQVRQLTISIRVQSTEVDEQTQQLESIAFTATFSARNMEYDAG